MLEKMEIALSAVLPSFFMMALGWGVRRILKLKKEEVQRLNQVIFYSMLSIMLFNNIYQGDLSTIRNLSFVGIVVGLLLITFVLSLAMGLLEPQRNRRGVITQACVRSNFVLLGLAILKELCPQANLAFASSLMAVYILLANILSVLVLEYYSEHETKQKTVIRNILKNPLILASALGMACSALHVRFPAVIERTLSQIGSSTTPVALLMLGAALEVKTIRRQMSSLTRSLSLRLLGIPLLTLLVGLALRVSREEAVLLLGFFATPPSASSYQMVCAIGGDTEFAANVAVLANILAVFSLVFWIVVFQQVGLI